MKRREFLKNAAALSAIAFIPAACLTNKSASTVLANGRLKTAHIGVGGMGLEDLKAMASHNLVDVTALCDVDSRALDAAHKLFPNAQIFKDYREMLQKLDKDIDAVVVSTPDHTHAPASLMAMELNKAVYCQKPLTHHVSEARAMQKMAEEKNLVTQMGIQVHSFHDYLAVEPWEIWEYIFLIRLTMPWLWMSQKQLPLNVESLMV